MRRHFLPLLLILLSASARAQELPSAQLAKVKDATVYVKYVAFRGLAMGSGYIFRRDGDTAWILTCDHVVKESDTVTVVFQSGRAGEKSLEAQVVARDKERDLACLRVSGEGLPAAIELSMKTEVRETESVFASGYPFGQTLATAGDNPGVAVTKVSVTSVRRDEAGEVSVVQLSGDVNPGNSGGPVVDAKGRLVGIATSRIQGTETIFVVPPEALRGFVKGRITKVACAPGAVAGGKAPVAVTVTVFDPMGKLQTSGCAWVRRDALREAPAADADGKWKAATASMKDVPLKLDPATGLATGTFEVARGGGGDVEVLVQAWCVAADGTKAWTAPEICTAKFGDGR